MAKGVRRTERPHRPCAPALIELNGMTKYRFGEQGRKAGPAP
jgi:hypothetical protein